MVGEITLKFTALGIPFEANDTLKFHVPIIFNTAKSRKDLQEYLGDFLNDISGSITIAVRPGEENRVTVFLYLYEGNTDGKKYIHLRDRGFSYDLPFEVVDKWDVPTFGNHMFLMWNSYVMAFVDNIELAPDISYDYDSGEMVVKTHGFICRLGDAEEIDDNVNKAGDKQ